MKRILLALLLLCAPAFATITVVQSSFPNINTTCGNTSGTTCTFTLTQAVTAGNTLVIAVAVYSSNATATSINIASIPAGNCSTSWTRPTGVNIVVASNYYVDLVYCPSGGLANGTSLAIPIAGTGASGGLKGGAFYEISPGGGKTLQFDTSTGLVQTTATTNPPGANLSAATPAPSGSNDWLGHIIFCVSGTISAIGSSYVVGGAMFFAGARSAYLNNTASFGAPTWTNATSTQYVTVAIAIKEVSSAAAPTQIGAFLIQ